MMRSAMTSICPILIIVAAAVVALYRRIRRYDLPGNRDRPLLPIKVRPPSRQHKESVNGSPAQEEEFVVVLGTSSGRIGSGSAGAFVERGAISEFEASPGDSAAPTLSSSPLRPCCTKSMDSLSTASSDVHVQQVTEDVLLPHPQLPRIRVS